jgi:hypothetical protein
MDETQLLVQAIVENAKVLGLKWILRPGRISVIDISRASAQALIDGDDAPVSVINLIGGINLNARVMCLIVPNEAVYVIGKLGNFLGEGELVVRVRQTTPQTFTTAVQDFIDFDTVDYDPLGWFSTNTPDRVIPQIAGWYFCVGRVVWASNATSRRLCGLNMNGSTSGAEGIGVQSLQTPATGTCQIQAAGAGLFDGVASFIGVRALQNSGGNLDTSSSDGGSTLEIYYSTPGRITA